MNSLRTMKLKMNMRVFIQDVPINKSFPLLNKNYSLGIKPRESVKIVLES